MEIFWTKKTNIQSITNDPLGFNNRLKLHYFDTLFLGLTVLISRAKYYILYPKFIQSLENHNCLQYSKLLDLEKAYLIAVCEHEIECKKDAESNKDHYGIPGKNKYKTLSSKELKDFDFEILQGNKSGYNLLKQNLLKIGLFKHNSYNDENELGIKLTSLGKRLVDNKLINPKLDRDKLIKNFKNNDCLCSLSKREQTLLRQVFAGDLKVIKLKEGGYDFIFDDRINKDFFLKDFLGETDKSKKRSILSKIRYHSLILILSIFREKRDDFLLKFVEFCFSEGKKFVKIKQLWQGYFLICGFQELSELTLYLIIEILKNNWDGKKDQEILVTFKEIEHILEKELIIEHKTKYTEFLQITNETQKIIKKMDEDKKKYITLIPNLIKNYCRILYNAFNKEPIELIKFIVNMDEGPTEYTLREFLNFYRNHNNLEDGQFVYHLFRDFCFPRQKNIIDDRHYKGTEKILLYETENEVIAHFSKLESFNPEGIFNQSKLTLNLIKIITDIGLIADNKLTKEGEKLLEEYNG